MSLDRSLKLAGGLAKHRNVLTRAERVARLVAKGAFDMGTGVPLHLPKVANRKVAAGGKSAAPKKEAAAAPAGTTAAAPAAGAAKPAAEKAPAAKAAASKATEKKK